MVPWKWGGLGELWCPRRALPISPSAFGLAVASQRAPCTRERAAAAADSLASSPWRSRRSVPRRVALQGHGAPTPKRFGPQIPEHRHESVPNPKVSTPRMPSGPVREPPFSTSLPLPSGGAAEVPSRNEGDRSAAAGFVAQRERRREVGDLFLFQQAAWLGILGELDFEHGSRPRTPIRASARHSRTRATPPQR